MLFMVKCLFTIVSFQLMFSLQGCTLRKIEGSPELWNCKIQGAQHMICVKNLRFSSCPRAKVRRQGPPDSARAQPCPITVFNFFCIFFLNKSSWLAGSHSIHTPGRYSNNFHTGRLHSDVQSSTLSYQPFIYFISCHHIFILFHHL